MSITRLHGEENPLSALIDKYEAATLTFDQLQNVPDLEWLIEDYIYEESFNVIWSVPKRGKSFLVLDMALSICTNTSWFGKKVNPCNVLYVAGEGVRGLKSRANSWVQARGIRPYEDQFRVLAKTVPLIEDSHGEALLQIAREQDAGLIVIDTLARAMVGHNENDNGDMGKLVIAVDRLREELGCAVILVHHSTIVTAGKGRMRGGGALWGALDTELYLDINEDDESMLTLTVDSMKDAAPAPPLNFFLEKVGDSLVPSKFKFTQRPGDNF